MMTLMKVLMDAASEDSGLMFTCGLWLMLLWMLLSMISLPRAFNHCLFPLLLGLYMSRKYQVMYGFVCLAGFILMGISVLPKSWNMTMCNLPFHVWMSETLHPALVRARFLLQDLRCSAFVFSIWYPTLWNWVYVLRLTSFACILTLANALLVIRILSDYDAEDKGIIACWLKISKDMLAMRNVATMAIVVALSMYTCFILHGVLVVVTVVAVLLACAAMLGSFPEVLESMSFHPRQLDYLETHFLMSFQGIFDIRCECRRFLTALETPPFPTWLFVGFLLATANSLSCWVGLCSFVSTIVLGLLCSISYLQHENKSSGLGPRFAFVLGCFVCLTLEMVCTGHMCGLRIGSIVNIFVIPFSIISILVWVLLVSVIAMAHASFYIAPFAFRWFLFQMWKLSNGTSRTLQLRVPHDTRLILKETLAQIPLPVSCFTEFTVKFSGDHPFTVDDVDLGGLSKEFCSRVSKALIVSDGQRSWPYFCKWDDRSTVYHLSLDANLLEQQKRDQADLMDALGEEVEKTDSEISISDNYQKLGIIFGMCFLSGYHLVPLSKSLIKFVCRQDSDSDFNITFEDLIEVRPDTASQLKNSPEHCDFEEVSCPAILALQVKTEFRNEDFQPPATPTDEQWNALARVILENEYILENMRSFKLGFRSVVGFNVGALFTPDEIQNILCGECAIDVRDWEANTGYRESSPDHVAVRRFWRELRASSQAELQAFCQFVTGNPTPPIGGFSVICPRFTIVVNGNVKDIVAHTCFNSIELPAHIDSAALRLQIQTIAHVH